MSKNKEQGPKKRKSRRSQAKYPALRPELNLKSRYDEIDYDYIHLLNKDEKEWLNNFTEEYVNANFQHKGEAIMTTKEEKKERYNRNNSRNRCIYTKSKAGGKLSYLEDLSLDKESKNKSPEELLIEKEEKELFNKNLNDTSNNTGNKGKNS